MNRKQAIMGVLAYYRHTGASRKDLQSYQSLGQQWAFEAGTDEAILGELEDAGDIYRVGDSWFLTSQSYRAARGPALEPPAWDSDDAWILMGIVCQEEPLLHEVIAAADFIYHAIPTAEILHRSLNRLASGRLIRTRRDGRCASTDRGREMFGRVENCCKKSMHDQHEGLERLLNCPCCGVRLRCVRWSLRLDKGLYDKAIQEYKDKWPKKPRKSSKDSKG